jgi:hypothetical protein
MAQHQHIWGPPRTEVRVSDQSLDAAMGWLMAMYHSDQYTWEDRCQTLLIRVAILDPKESLPPETRRWLLGKATVGNPLQRRWIDRLLVELEGR